MTTAQKQKGPATAPTVPSHGSIIPEKDMKMNATIDTTASAVEQEMICDKVDRLARELSEALPQWANGSFMAMVYPDGDVRGYWFRSLTRDENGNATDPLVKVINDHNKAWSEYCAADFDAEDELRPAWQKPYDVLCCWDNPCSSKDGAIAAMKLALDEIDAGQGPLAKPMLLAALGYLEGAAA